MSELLQLEVAIAVLREKGATEIVISYSGGGDSGGIDSTVARGPAPDVPLFDLQSEVKDAIEEWAWEHAIPGHVGGWNNEGGHGSVTIDLNTRQVLVEHHERYQREDLPMFEKDFVLTGDIAKLFRGLGPKNISTYWYTSDDGLQPGTLYDADKKQQRLNTSDEQDRLVEDWLDSALKTMPDHPEAESWSGDLAVKVTPKKVTAHVVKQAQGLSENVEHSESVFE